MRFEEWETLWIARESVGGVVDASMIGQEGSARTLVSRATLPSLRTFRATLAQILEAIEHLSDGRRIRRNASTFSNDLEKGKTRAEPSRAEPSRIQRALARNDREPRTAVSKTEIWLAASRRH